MEFAGESKETTYFDEEAAAAKEAVDGKQTSGLLQAYLLRKIPCGIYRSRYTHDTRCLYGAGARVVRRYTLATFDTRCLL